MPETLLPGSRDAHRRKNQPDPGIGLGKIAPKFPRAGIDVFREQADVVAAGQHDLEKNSCFLAPPGYRPLVDVTNPAKEESVLRKPKIVGLVITHHKAVADETLFGDFQGLPETIVL